MDSDEKSLDSAPTMGPGGIRNGGSSRPAEPFDEHSIGSAPTMGGRTTPQGGRLRPGDVLLGRYTVLAELGEGGMGVVYKCLDTIGGIEVAIKCLPPELSRNESEMEAIRENYAIVARLHHSAISGLRQLEKDSEFGEYYLVMDLAKGEDLSTILRRRRGVPMPLDEALAILRPLASALDYAHGEHVLHRDVKPANVKVDGIRVQLLDFGLAAEVRSSMSRVSLRGHAGSSGTPAYMAPEQWEARRQSAATDQYSLAVMAYEMLAGYRPFDTDNMELLKSAVLTRAPEEIEGVPAYVNATLQKALAKNPKERFASCTEFVEAISNAEPQSAQRDFHTEAQRHGESISGATKPESRILNSASDSSTIGDADILRRKVASASSQTSLVTPCAARHQVKRSTSLRALGIKGQRVVTAPHSSPKRRNHFWSHLLLVGAISLGVLAVIFMFCLREDGEPLRLAYGNETSASAFMKNPQLEKATKDSDLRGRVSANTNRYFEKQSEVENEIELPAGTRKTISLGSQTLGFRYCPPDTFTMGSPYTEEGRYEKDEEPHIVTISHGFWICETEVTQGLWREILGEKNYYYKMVNDQEKFSFVKAGNDYPIVNISWDDCQRVVSILNSRYAQLGLKWVLPSEAQWEYACRAGTNGKYGGNGNLEEMGWYVDNSDGTIHPVAQKAPNAWGLYDMHGNAWEWCADKVNSPFENISYGILRGGSCDTWAKGCRSAYRERYPSNLIPEFGGQPNGFRLALVNIATEE